MAHPIEHAKSSVKKWGGCIDDYINIHNWFDETKAWIAHSKHRLFRHHSEGIFECEKIFGKSMMSDHDLKESRVASALPCSISCLILERNLGRSVVA